jgi:ethanolamine utilization protein EutQ
MTARRQLLTAEAVSLAFEKGVRELSAPGASWVVTPAAWSKARELGVAINREASPRAGGCQRTVEPSGVVVVRGESVKLARFAGAGADRNVGLLDVVTREQGSPMAAGFMKFGKADSFPWRLDYDEVDYVVEGILHITVDGRVVEGRVGDVLYVPKGSSIVFGTPNRVHVFYVTYPAEWATPK